MKGDQMKTLSMRLAFREEGKFWNCYVALEHTMEGAYILGSIGLGAIDKNDKVKRAFMEVMKLAFSDAVKEVTGSAPVSYDEHVAAS
jgi:hypothetical protein